MVYYSTMRKDFKYFVCIFKQNRAEVLINRIKFMEIIKNGINDFQFLDCNNINSKFSSRFV